MKSLTGLLTILCLCFTSAVMAKDFYVNPTGNDLWSGTLKTPNTKLTDGPFKTLVRAQNAIRSLKKTNTFTEPVTINIASGTYYLSQYMYLTALDSGLLGKEIVWQGEPGAKVIISGGIPITCNKRDAMYWDCPLTKVPVSTAYFDANRIKGNTPKFELFVNDQKLQLARWPDSGWAHIKLPLDQKTQFSAMETLPALIGNIKAAQVHIFAGNDWFDQFIGVDSANTSTNSIKLSAPTSYNLESGRLFYIQNLPSLLDASGEWLFDAATKKVTFISPAGITPTSFTLSSLSNIIIADGVNYLTFKNISFQHSTGTAITLTKSNNVSLDQLDINNVGGKGVEIRNGLNVTLSNSKIHHTGGHGVISTGGDRNTLQASGHVIHNNHIHHMGTKVLTYTAGIEVNGVGTKVTHNLLEQGPSIAILITGNDHLIEKNEVHHFCLQSSDCGAIYSGRNWSWRGNVISNNYIHDMSSYGLISVDLANNKAIYGAPSQPPGGSRGVYLDDGVSGFYISGNIFENAGLLSIQIGGGRDNKVINNYFKTNATAIYLEKRYDSSNPQTLETSPYKTATWQQKYPELMVPINDKTSPEGNRIERNVIVTTKPDGKSLLYYVPKGSTVIGDNIVWSTTGKLLVDYRVLDVNMLPQNAKPWSQWVAEGIEQGSLVIDPCVTIVNKKMNTCTDSPIKDIGFDSLPSDIGLIP